MKKTAANTSMVLILLFEIATFNIVTAQSNNLSSNNFKSSNSIETVLGTSSTEVDAMYFYNTSIGWVYGINGIIAKTTDGGTQWIRQNSFTDNFILKIFFINPNIGWACGYNGTFLQTTNGGNLWTPQQLGTTKNIISVFFLNKDKGWMVGDSGIILATQNGGTTWIPQESGTANSLRSIKFTDTNTGWIVGGGGCILHTTNGGVTWTPQNSTTTIILWNASFPDSLHGYAVGGNPSASTIFLKTTDGGTSWLTQTPPASTLFDLGFINADTGWVVGQGGYILKTTDGGNNWSSQGTTIFWLSWASFLNSDTGYVLAPGTTPRLLTTTNGGNSWNVQDITVTNPPMVVSFTPLRNALNIAENTTITVTFDADIDPTTLTNSTIRINGSLSGLYPCTFNYNTETRTATITHDNQFKVGELVTATLTRGIKVANGDSLQSSYSWSFTVKTNPSSGLYYQSSTAGVGNTPWYLTAADFNGDSAIDLAVVNNYSNDVSILTNNGNGIFTKTSTINVGSYPGSITTADLDSDGDMDLAVTNSGSNTVSILKNDGNGTFTQTSAITVEDYPWNVAAADLDGDGDMDLAVGSYSSIVSILKNDGGGSFTRTSTVTVGSIAYSVTAADLDCDGAIDLAVTNYGSNTISILKNNGSGAFTETSTIDVGSGPLAVAASDLDGNGSLDLAVVNFSSNTVSILKNNDGNGTFTLTSTINTENLPTSVIAMDSDGNGIMDLVVVNGTAGTVSILQNDGNGSFTTVSTISTGVGGGPRIITSADLNDDGRIDLAVVNQNFNNVSIFSANAQTISITDVPNDNGRQVFLTWTTNGSPIDSGVTNFSIYRYDQQAWTYIKDVPVLSDSVYQTIVPTLYDSTISQGMFWSVFKVLARTADPSVYKTIGPDSGYSVDNLPPLAPTNGIAIRLSNGNILIQWRAAVNANGDFKEYVLYRSTQSDFVPSPATRIAFVQDTVYTDLTTQGNNFYYKTTSKDYAGNESQPLVIGTTTTVELVNSHVPQTYSLTQNYPNPFNPSTQIQFSIVKAGYVTLKVFNLSGQEVASLISWEMTPGTYAVPFSATNLSSGMYFYRLQAGIFSSTKKMLVVK